MNNTQFILIIICAVIIGLGVISLIIFNVIFILKRHYINLDYKLKVKFNNFNNNKMDSSIKYIENLAQKNPKLLPILTYLKDKNNTYNKQLEIVKIKLRNLSKLLKSYKLVQISKTLKQINDDFEKLNSQCEDYKKINLDTQKYSNDLNAITIKLFDIISEIEYFNKTNNIKIFFKHVKEFQQIDKDINNITASINEEIDSIDWENAHRLLLNELSISKQYYEFSKNLFKLSNFNTGLTSLINKLRQESENLNKNGLDDNQYISLFKKLKTISDKANDKIASVNKKNVNEIIDDFRELIAQLEKSLRSIKVDTSYNQIYNEYYSIYTNVLSKFMEIIKEHNIVNLCKNILTIFPHDHEIKTLAINNQKISTDISKELTLIEELHNDKAVSNRNENIVKHIVHIFELMMSFKENNDNLFKTINKKNKNIFEIITELNECSYKLMMLEQYVSKYKINDSELIKKIETNKKVINSISDEIKNDLSIPKHDLRVKLNDVQLFINDSTIMIKNKIELIGIMESLKMYANKYKDNTNKQQFKEFDKLYKEAKYLDLIEAYISFITKSNKNKKVA